MKVSLALEANNVVSRYCGGTSRNPSPEELSAASLLLEKVRAAAKFSFGLGRNWRKFTKVAEDYNNNLKSDKLDAYRKAFREVINEHIKDTEKNKEFWKDLDKLMLMLSITDDEREVFEKKLYERYDIAEVVEKLELEHDVKAIELELENRRKELLDADAGVEPYRIPVTQIPGWGSPDGDKGLITPTDLAVLFDAGILYDPSEEPEKKS